jgi:inosose dehydratase
VFEDSSAYDKEPGKNNLADIRDLVRAGTAHRSRDGGLHNHDDAFVELIRRNTMDRFSALSRRDLVRLGASAAALSTLARVAPAVRAAAPDAADPWLGLKVGVASYTFSKLPLAETIAGLRRVGVHYVSIKDAHLPLKSTADQRKAVVKAFRDAGITPLSCGVISMSDSESEIRNAFEYARDAALPTIVCKPTQKSLPILDKLVKEFDIKLAIHNHGPEDKVWPSPYDAWEAVQSFDKRIGLCIDVGHTARCGVNPAEAIRKCAGRLYDLHFKDIDGAGANSKPVEVGRGVLDTRAMLRALVDVGYAHHVGLEHEKDMKDPLPGVAESIGYIWGVLSGLRTA